MTVPPFPTIAESSSQPSRLVVGLCLVGLFFVSFFLVSRHNQFPFYAHPDERGKAAQVLDQTRNFHHPLLMLTVAGQTTRIVKDYINRKPTYQETVEIGRWIAALFTAGAITLFTWTAWRLAGGFAAVALAFVQGLDPALFWVAHFMKEDPTLLCSLGGLFVGITFFNRQPNARNTLLLGGLAGLVCSAKYTGLISLAILLPYVWWRLRNERRVGVQIPPLSRLWLLFAGGLLVVFLLFNHPMLLEYARFSKGFGREVTEVVVGAHGVRKIEVPHAQYFVMLWEDLPRWIWPFFVVYAWLLLRMQPGRRSEYLVPVLIVGALLAMISFSPKISARYLQPVHLVLLLGFCAVTGFIFRGCLPIPAWLGKLVAVGLVAGLLHFQWHGREPGRAGFAATYESFQSDSYDDLRDWIRKNLPANAVLLQPEKRFLPDPELGFYDDVAKDLPQTIYSQSTFIKSGSLQLARATGITHIVVLYGATKKYVGPVISLTETAKIDRARRANFFEEMKTQGRRVYKQAPNRNNLLLHPGFEIYEIQKPGINPHLP